MEYGEVTWAIIPRTEGIHSLSADIIYLHWLLWEVTIAIQVPVQNFNYGNMLPIGTKEHLILWEIFSFFACI